MNESRLVQRWYQLRRFLGRKVWRLFWLAGIVGTFFFVVDSLFIFVFQGFLGAVGLVDYQKLMLPSWYPHSLSIAMSTLILFGLLRAIAFGFKTVLAGLTCQTFIREQRSRLLEFGLSNAGQMVSHEVIAVFTDRVGQVGSVLHGLSQLILVVTTSAFLIALGLRLAPAELMIGVILLGLFLLPLRLLDQRIRVASRVLVDELDQANRSLLQGLRNHLFLQVYGMIPEEIRRGKRSLQNYANHYNRYYIVSAIKSTLPVFVGITVIGCITFISVHFLKTPSAKLVAFFYIFIRLAQNASEINVNFTDLRLQYPSFQQLQQWQYKMETQIKTESDAEGSAMRKRTDTALNTKFDDSVRLDGIRLETTGLGFSFHERSVLKKVNFRAQTGDILLLTGESGTGKSTLIALLLGVLKPEEGKILYNGFDLAEIKERLPSCVGYVGPEPFLIPGTVRENLLYGHPSPSSMTDAKIWKMLEAAQIAWEIRSLANGLNETLKEQTQLSTGQKQRLSIARALLRDPKLLILDEATANLDPDTEARLIAELSPWFKQMTTIIVSHKKNLDSIATQRLQLRRYVDIETALS